MNSMLSIICDSTSWQDVYNQLKKYDGKISGKLFEHFCKYYYQTEPSVKSDYKNVWLFSEIPLDVKEKLKLGKTDHGIDIVLEDHAGTFSAVQCKFKHDQNSSLSWSKDKLTNFFADGDNAHYLIIFTNASKIDQYSLKKKENLKIVTWGDLMSLSMETISNIKNIITGKPAQVTKKNPRSYQCIAIREVLKGFEQYHRGQLILPCGAGKTLISLWIKEAMGSNYTLVLVPSLALLRQVKNEWASNHEHTPYICVCSEKDIDKRRDIPDAHLYEVSGRVSTNPIELQDFLKENRKCIVYSTYQSLEALCLATKSSKFSFDLAICDEAHKTSGAKSKKFGLVHHDNEILIKKRLYMTATPRIIANHLKSKLKNRKEIEYVYDMDNPAIFGHEFFKMSFKEAIDNGILLDYKIEAIGVTNKDLQSAIKKRKYCSDREETIDEIANSFALDNFMNKYALTHALTFHSQVKKAQNFTERHKELFPTVKSYHVNGNQTANERSIFLKEFEASNKAIITNARCLTEGIDIPAINIVYFCDPKNSKIDIVQAAGRALRRSDHTGKIFGYIVVPIFHHLEERLEDIIESSPYNNLITVIRSLASYDERIADEIKKIKIGLGERKNLSNRICFDESCNLISFTNFHEDLGKRLFNETISKFPLPYETFEKAKAFIHSLKFKSSEDWKNFLKNGNKPNEIPATPDRVYKHKGWVSWGDWFGTNKIATQKMKYLPFEKARSLVHQLQLKIQLDWYRYCNSGKKPDNIPSNPHNTYRKKGWLSYGDWLGSGSVATFDRKYLPFEEAREFVHSLKLKSQKEWNGYRKNKPKYIPSNPNETYKEFWKGWGDWLGTYRIADKDKKFLPFYKAREFVTSLGINSETMWRKYSRSGNKPADIPAAPEQYYKGKGWISWPHWLGTKL